MALDSVINQLYKSAKNRNKMTRKKDASTKCVEFKTSNAHLGSTYTNIKTKKKKSDKNY